MLHVSVMAKLKISIIFSKSFAVLTLSFCICMSAFENCVCFSIFALTHIALEKSLVRLGKKYR